MAYQTWMGERYVGKPFFKDKYSFPSFGVALLTLALGVGFSFAFPDSPHLKDGGNASNDFNPIQTEYQTLETRDLGN